MKPWKRKLRAFFIACLGFFYDVRITRRGKVHLNLRNKRKEKKMLKKGRVIRSAQ